MVDALKTTFSVHITLLSAAVFQIVVVTILSVEKFFVSPDEGGILNTEVLDLSGSHRLLLRNQFLHNFLMSVWFRCSQDTSNTNTK